MYILGICGALMTGVARLGTQLGISVQGCDKTSYPPMSDQLDDLAITVQPISQNWCLPQNDYFVIGNGLPRGDPTVEAVLAGGSPYTSAPQWLFEHILRHKKVLCVAGTHGKTTTTAMLAWILHFCRRSPGFLLGGVPKNFGVSAQTGLSKLFVIEGDECGSAFFDKRPKFLHYRPHILVINNIEFDHADIFQNLGDIQKQFTYLLRTVPPNGLVLANASDMATNEVIRGNSFSDVHTFGWHSGPPCHCYWSLAPLRDSYYDVIYRGRRRGTFTLNTVGNFNVLNALAAIAAAHRAGVEVEDSCQALSTFEGVKRRMEKVGECKGLEIYDDFAHHPTSIKAGLTALRKAKGRRAGKILVLFEPRSNSMRMNAHAAALAAAFAAADRVFVYTDGLPWKPEQTLQDLPAMSTHVSSENLLRAVLCEAESGDIIVTMSNGIFGGVLKKLCDPETYT